MQRWPLLFIPDLARRREVCVLIFWLPAPGTPTPPMLRRRRGCSLPSEGTQSRLACLSSSSPAGGPGGSAQALLTPGHLSS